MKAPLFALAVLLAGCAAAQERPAPGPEFRPDIFFLGRTEATGQFEARDGTVSRRFTQVIDGRREGDTLVIDQLFTYDDGEIEPRQWRLVQTGPNRYSAISDAAAASGAGTIENGVFVWRWTYENASSHAWDDLNIVQRMVLHDERTALRSG